MSKGKPLTATDVARLRRAQTKANRSAAELDALVADLLEQGCSTRDVASVLGISHVAVQHARIRAQNR